MANYTSIHAGSVIDNVTSNALLKTEAASIYLTQANAASMYPLKNGTGATGTWGISISGNAINDGSGNNIIATYMTKAALKFEIITTATDNNETINWKVLTFPDNTVFAYTSISVTRSHYTTTSSFYGYYIAGVKFPVTFDSTGCSITHAWTIGSGFAIPAALIGNRTTSCNFYGLGTASGSQSCRCDIQIIGKKAS